MIWQVQVDGVDIYDPTDPELPIFSPVLKFEDNKAASFSFGLPIVNRHYGDVHKLASVVDVFYNGVLYFRGRPLNDSIDFYNSKKIVCESELALLNDAVQRPFSFPMDDNASPEDYLRFLINGYNASMPAEKHFVVGTVTVTDPNNYIARSDTEYSSTWRLVKEGLLDTLGGHLVVRYADGLRFLDYLAELPELSTQPITFGENLLDISTERRGEDIATAIMPLGAVNEDTGERLTIQELPDSETDDVCKQGDFVYSKAAEAQYGGRIIKPLILDDVTTANYLLNKARAKLSEARNVIASTTIKAADLSAAGYEVDPFMIGRYVYVTSEPHAAEHELQPYYFISAATINMFEPDKNTVTVGASYMSLSESTAKGQSAIVQQFNAADIVSRVESRKDIDAALVPVELTLKDHGEQIEANYNYAAATNAEVVALKAYIKVGNIGTDAQGRPIIGVSIGQQDLLTAFKSAFTAEAVEFYEGSDKTAFLSNKKLNVQTVRANNLELSDDLGDPQRTDWQITSDSRGFTVTYIGG